MPIRLYMAKLYIFFVFATKKRRNLHIRLCARRICISANFLPSRSRQRHIGTNTRRFVNKSAEATLSPPHVRQSGGYRPPLFVLMLGTRTTLATLSATGAVVALRSALARFALGLYPTFGFRQQSLVREFEFARLLVYADEFYLDGIARQADDAAD